MKRNPKEARPCPTCGKGELICTTVIGWLTHSAEFPTCEARLVTGLRVPEGAPERLSTAWIVVSLNGKTPTRSDFPFQKSAVEFMCSHFGCAKFTRVWEKKP